MKTRFNKIRLDKTKKPDNHLFGVIKVTQNIKHEHLTAYPELKKYMI